MPSDSDSALVHARLYTRADCSLCERAERILQRMADEGELAWSRVDIGGEPMLTNLYGARIPVIELSTGVVVEGRISEFRLRRHLSIHSTLSDRNLQD